VWIDSLGRVDIGDNVCLSQGCMIETGNHDWSDPAFALIVRPVALENGSWAAVRSLLLPGSRLARYSVLAAGAVLSGETEPNAIYVGVPARKVKTRAIRGVK
jgi:putative colanic acid biosynthesis acetyltransferase WcaF